MLYISCGLSAMGCDPARTTLQSVRLGVVDSVSGKPVVGADVSVKYDFETGHPLSKETHEPPEEWHKHKHETWERQPWFRAVTDKDGKADIAVKYTALDRSWGSKPPDRRDWITGNPFLVRLKAGQAPEEESSILMKPGETVKGESCRITVINIQEPRYIETEND